jgi:hypothetical protein
MFQCLVPGIDVRVHVVSGETFACAIEADRLDYRYAARLAMRPIDIDAKLRNRIVAMVRAMGLHVAWVDLRHRPDGGWTCLEVNPSRGFTWFGYTGQPIADAIAALLLGDAGHSSFRSPLGRARVVCLRVVEPCRKADETVRRRGPAHHHTL